MRNRTTALVGGIVAAAVALTPLVASAATKKTVKKATSAATSLKGVCPAKIVIQTDWFPEAEHGALYQMVGAPYSIDLGKKTVTGPLIGAKGVKTGIDIEVRTGGPAIGFQGPSAVMATDSSITMGYSGNGEANT